MSPLLAAIYSQVLVAVTALIFLAEIMRARARGTGRTAAAI
jgi:hypothetical protein